MHLTKIFWASLTHAHFMLFSPIKDKSKGKKTERSEVRTTWETETDGWELTSFHSICKQRAQFKPIPCEEYDLQGASIAREDPSHPNRIHITLKSGDVLKLRAANALSRSVWVAAFLKLDGVRLESAPPPATPGLSRFGRHAEASKVSLLSHSPVQYDPQ
jgi:hypothetical protein